MSEPERPAPSLSDRIRAALEADILAGRRLPGSAIDEKALAQAFEASRTPVREALLVLASQGLVTIAPRAGIYVARPSTAELVALLECLAEFEAVAARLAAQRMDGLAREQLRAANAATAHHAQADDRAAYEPANQVFHDLIYRGCGNPVLAEEIRGVRRRLAAFRRRVLDQPGRLQVSQQDHEAICAAILAGHEERAGAAMREHILAKGKAVADLVLVASAA